MCPLDRRAEELSEHLTAQNIAEMMWSLATVDSVERSVKLLVYEALSY